MDDKLEPARDDAASSNRILINYAVLIGLTPLIPVPLADDLVKGYFQRRLIRALAEARGLSLTGEALDALAKEQTGGCSAGCLIQVVLYPLKKVFRKVFYFLEWKRAVDLTSHSYHYGYLIDYAFREGLAASASEGGGRGFEELRAAVEAACREAPIKPLESVISTTFRQSKAALSSAAELLGRSLRGLAGRPDREQVAREVGAVEEEEKEEVRGLVENLQRKIGNIPEAHFAALRERFKAHLAGGSSSRNV